MIISNDSVAAAIRTFMTIAGFPRPDGWTTRKDGVFLRNRIVPAFLRSLSEIEDVRFALGCNEDRIYDVLVNKNLDRRDK